MATGFQIPSYEDTRVLIVDNYKNTFGQNANTASTTVDGLLIDSRALFQTRHFEAVGEANNAHFYGTAVGLQLDALIGGLFGFKRLPASGSFVQAWLYGTLGTIISATSTAIALGTSTGFAVDEDATIVAADKAVFLFGAPASPTTITVNLGAIPTQAIFSGGETAEQVATSVASALAANANQSQSFAFGVQPDDLAIVEVQMIGTHVISVFSSGGSDVEDHYAVETQLTSQDIGEIEAAQGTLTQIGTAVPGWRGLVNLEAATLGRTGESDPEYKARWEKQRDRTGSGRIDTMNSKVAAIDGVRTVVTYHNTKSFTDAFGRPPHSFEVVVDGGDPDEIAEVILLDHQWGIGSFGSISKLVEDSRGQVTEIREVFFTRPTIKYMHARIDITPGEGFPTTTTADLVVDIANLLTAYGNTLLEGQDVQIPDSFGAITAGVPGIGVIVIFYGSTPNPGDPTPGLTFANFVVDEREQTNFDPARMTVNFV